MITSRALVAANNVRSRVRPANRLFSCFGMSESVVIVSEKPSVFFDCNNLRLSHAATKVDTHLESLV